MKKFIEFGLGNSWLLRTEIEHENGEEVEKRGIIVRVQKGDKFRMTLAKNVTSCDNASTCTSCAAKGQGGEVLRTGM